MKIKHHHYRSIFLAENGFSVCIFDQKKLPWHFDIISLDTYQQAATAISDMTVRGAPLLAMVGAYGMALAMRTNSSDAMINIAYQHLVQTRPTAINLKWALDIMRDVLRKTPEAERITVAYAKTNELCWHDTDINQKIGTYGLTVIKNLFEKHQRPINILTHCNAGWLATTDYGTATAPIYMAHDNHIPVHIWVDETRPRNQGLLTAFELSEHGVPHHLICDNTGGLLMLQGKVDMCIVGADRVTKNGDVCNKIGTYLKALAAYTHQIPFYVALPTPTIDKTLASGMDIPIEERDSQEVTQIYGTDMSGNIGRLHLTNSPAHNPGFDITPARYITGYITENGILSGDDFV